MCRARQSLRSRVTAESEAFQPILAASVALTMDRRTLAAALADRHASLTSPENLPRAMRWPATPELNCALPEVDFSQVPNEAGIRAAQDECLLIKRRL